MDMKGQGNEQGYVLLSVLILVAIVASTLALAIQRNVVDTKQLSIALSSFFYSDEVGGASKPEIKSTAGFIDLNSASPELISSLAETHGPTTKDLLISLAARRREGHRLVSVDAFARSPLFEDEWPTYFLTFFTVHSSRSGKDPNTASLEALTGRTGDRETIAAALPEAWRARPNNRIFHMLAPPTETSAGRRLGVVAVDGASITLLALD